MVIRRSISDVSISFGTLRMEKTLEPSARGRAARRSDPPPRLDTPKAPDVSVKTNSGTGEPPDDLEIRSEILPSAGRFKNASRVMRKKASNRRAEACSSITAFDASRAAKEIE
jgi:hypothetical protein